MPLGKERYKSQLEMARKMEESTAEIKKFILRELIKRKKIGGAHTPLDKITRSLPDKILEQIHRRKIIDQAIKELVNSGMIILQHKMTGKGSDFHIAINPRAWKEIGLFLNLPRGEI